MIKESNNNKCWECGQSLENQPMLYNKLLQPENEYIIYKRCGLCGNLNICKIKLSLREIN